MTASVSSSKPYREAAAEFIRQLRQHNSPAADCVAQIQAQYGSRAAYLAGFALTMLKEWQIEHGYAPDERRIHGFTYTEEMKANAEALRLYDQAASLLLEE